MTIPALLSAALLATSPAVPFEREIDDALAETSAIYPVPKALVLGVITVESGFNPRAVSPAGAKGLMQLVPRTAAHLGAPERDLFDARANVRAGVRLLAVLLRHYEGDVISTLVAYNCGPRPMGTPIPRNGETPEYIWRVLVATRRWGRHHGRVDGPR